jgi:undecaprenyl-diphosphatase
MDSQTTTYLISWVITHGYWLFFVATFFEGPLVTAAAGVAAALGYFNIELIVLISIMGDTLADSLFFAIGYFGGIRVIKKYGHHVGVTDERREKIKTLLHGHTRKTVALVKLAPVIPVPGILTLGSMRVSFRKFFETSLLITIPKSTFFALAGYFSGKTYVHLGGLVNKGEYVMWLMVPMLIVVYIVYQKISKFFSSELE